MKHNIALLKVCIRKLLVCTLFSLMAVTLHAKASFALSEKERCPTEKYDSVTVQGIYLGWQIPFSPDGTITVRLRHSHAPLHIIATETRARHLFNRQYNAPVEVTYDFIQVYTKEENRCRQFYILKTGKILQEKEKSKITQ